MSETRTGSCFCGAVTIAVRGAPLEMGYCHCKSCRHYSGAPVTAYLLFKSEDVTVTKGAECLGRYSKTPMSDRQHCTKCGGHLLVSHPSMGLTDVRPALFPDIAFRPTVHLHYGETVLPMKDGLTKLKDFPVEAGGSGETLPE